MLSSAINTNWEWDFDPLPRILIISYAIGPDIETTEALTWLTNNCLKAGIHLFLVANRINDKNLSSDVKANISGRAVFTVTSAQKSKYAGVKGAESLSEGEMLYKQRNVDPKKFMAIFTPQIKNQY